RPLGVPGGRPKDFCGSAPLGRGKLALDGHCAFLCSRLWSSQGPCRSSHRSVCLGIVHILGMASNESRDPSPVWQDSQHPVHGRLGFAVPLAFLCWQDLAQHLCSLH
ncbi:hypothetical protein BGZ90_009644, partial [Linnemannia elongata]